MTNKHLLALVTLIAFFLSGCGLFSLGADVTTAKTEAQKPNDLTVYVTVADEGEPVGYLGPSNFEIYENEVLLEREKIGLRLLPRDKIASAHTVLLLDLSGSPEEKDLARISRGAAHFVEKVSVTQPVTVVAFDGTARAREVATFSKVASVTKRPLPPLNQFLSQDDSRDLNSAVLSAIKGLNSGSKKGSAGVHFGTVATFLTGPDLAGRITDRDLQKAITESGYEFYSLAPQGVRFNTLHQIGQDKRFEYSSMDTLPMRFADFGMRVRDSWKSHYLVSYCSPARAGVRKLKVRVKFESNQGKTRTGSSKSEFDASGFEGGCQAKNSDQAVEVEPAADTPRGKGRLKETKVIGRAPEENEDNIVAPPSGSKYE